MSKPEAGQWWFKNVGSGRVFVVGRRDDGRVVFQGEPEGLLIIDLKGWDNWHHEPRCTGWDWVVPDQQPAEDPDEWVILDPVKYADHVPRTGIDWFMDGKNEWVLQASYHGSRTVGDHFRWCDKHHRCRRRDLPKVEQQLSAGELKAVCDDVMRWQGKQQKTIADECIQSFDCANGDHLDACPVATQRKPDPQPQKTRVRLWIPRKWNSRSAIVSTRIDDKESNLWQEIHHDADGFYVENQP